MKVVAPAVKLSETPATIRSPAPLVGQHSREVLEEFGFPPDEIERLIEQGAIGQTDV